MEKMNYYMPDTLDEALSIMASEDVIVLAGGSVLMEHALIRHLIRVS